MINLDGLIGLNKEIIRNKIIFIYLYNDKFSDWYENKFLKYGGCADLEDIRVLTESIYYAINEVIENY